MIIHIIQNVNDPNKVWDSYNEKDNFYGSEIKLGIYRNVFKNTIHRGFYPDRSKVSKTPESFRNVPGFKVYWMEIK